MKTTIANPVMNVNEINEVVRLHSVWLAGQDGGIRADLSGTNMRYADLSNADLSNADLSGTNMGNADLSGTNMRYADLSGTNMRYADLSNADLSNADLSGTDMRYADLSNADLSNADLSGADLSNANLSGTNMRYADLRNTDMRYADLSNADMSGADMRYAIGDGDHICTIQTGVYVVVIYNQSVSIGCRSYSWAEWARFDDIFIHSMDNQKAVDFWHVWKPILTAIMEVR